MARAQRRQRCQQQRQRDRQQPAGATKGREGGQEEWVGGRNARRSAVKGLLPLTGDIPSRGCCAIWNSRDDLPGRLEGQWQRRWMPWRCDDGRRTTYDDAVDGVRHYPQRTSTGACFDAGRLTTQHLSDGSYYAITNLMLREGRRHAVRVRRGRGRRAQIGRNNQI